MDGYAKQLVAELLHRAAYAVDHKDMVRLAACFHKNARFSLAIDGIEDVSAFEGRDAIMSLMRSSVEAQTDVRRHVISNIWYEQTSERTATVVSYVSLAATNNGETSVLTAGEYRDQVAKAGPDGGWVLMDRYLHLDRAL